MKHILFVDDEPDVLQGLQRVLMDRIDDWDMQFVDNGKEALEILARQHIDVIISDMRMPGLDGASLLHQVHERHPDVVRIILTGHSGMEATLRAMPVAHSFLTKPCQPGMLEETVSRAFDLQQLLNGDELRKIAGGVDKLPVQPEVYNQLTRALMDPKADINRVAKIVTKDLGLCSKLLHLTNSAFFGFSRKFSTAEQAVSFIGLRMIREVVLSAEVFGAFENKQLGGLSLENEQKHAMACAGVARRIAPKELSENAFLAGMLHDIGKLVLATRAPKTMRRLLDSAPAKSSMAPDAETEIAAVDHGTLGAYLLGLWNLSPVIVEAVAYHHRPKLAGSHFGLTSIVHIANGLVHELAQGEAQPGGEPALDLEYVEATGATPQLDQWRAIAKELWSLEAQDGS
jgi:HD-like signal output (HDOD) protein/CheY-like chemotaxis protein